ncbi:hypothetical protein C8R45DRAFT_1106156 [Mycena sanguinolenta]|nr:hypothetical protein C8R45DRAFT_1106156 [Mycena sanguinolenta]
MAPESNNAKLSAGTAATFCLNPPLFLGFFLVWLGSWHPGARTVSLLAPTHAHPTATTLRPRPSTPPAPRTLDEDRPRPRFAPARTSLNNASAAANARLPAHGGSSRAASSPPPLGVVATAAAVVPSSRTHPSLNAPQPASHRPARATSPRPAPLDHPALDDGPLTPLTHWTALAVQDMPMPALDTISPPPRSPPRDIGVRTTPCALVTPTASAGTRRRRRRVTHSRARAPQPLRAALTPPPRPDRTLNDVAAHAASLRPHRRRKRRALALDTPRLLNAALGALDNAARAVRAIPQPLDTL